MLESKEEIKNNIAFHKEKLDVWENKLQMITTNEISYNKKRLKGFLDEEKIYYKEENDGCNYSHDYLRIKLFKDEGWQREEILKIIEKKEHDPDIIIGENDTCIYLIIVGIYGEL